MLSNLAEQSRLRLITMTRMPRVSCDGASLEAADAGLERLLLIDDGVPLQRCRRCLGESITLIRGRAGR